MPKNAFFGLFSKICLRRRKFGKNAVFIKVWESSENHFARPKKRQNFQIFFENPPPPLEKFLDPHLIQTLFYVATIKASFTFSLISVSHYGSIFLSSRKQLFPISSDHLEPWNLLATPDRLDS